MKKTCSVIAILIICAFCAFANGSGEATNVVPDKPTELTFFGFKTANEAKPIEDLVARFNETHPSIHVTYEGVTKVGGYKNILTTRMASGQGDDIILLGSEECRIMQNADYVVDLSCLAVSNNYVTNNYIDGKIPGLPMEMSLFGMYVNLDLLKSMNLEIPRTYTEFMDTCEVLKKEGMTPIVAGSSDGTGAGLFVCTRGLYDVYLKSQDTMEEIRALDFGEKSYGETLRKGIEWAALVRDLGYVDAKQALVSAPLNDSLAEFAKGQTAFMFMGSWAVATFKKVIPDMNIAFVGIPSNDDGPVVVTSPSSYLAINAASKHKKEAEEFVNFMLETANNNFYCQGQNAFSCLKDGEGTKEPIAAESAALISSGRSFPWNDVQFQNFTPWPMLKEIGANIFGGSSVDEAIKEADEKIKLTLALI